MTLLSKIERTLVRTGMSATRFGRYAVRDPRLLHDMRRGRQLRAETEARVARFLRDLAGGDAR